jgi:hypothetical protein
MNVSLSDLGIEGAGASRSTIVGNGGTVVLQAGYRVDAVLDRAGIAVRLERKLADSSWEATGATATATHGTALTVATPAYATEQPQEAVEYRLASRASVSNPVTVVYENQRDYTGLAATMYRYAAPYCPNTAVHVARLDGREAGLFGTGSLLMTIDPAVGVSVNADAVSQRQVALHECSHERQWVNYGETGAGERAMEADAARYFTEGSNGAKPIEHAADCGARAANPGGYLGYGGYCTRSELDEGLRLLQGQRY